MTIQHNNSKSKKSLLDVDFCANDSYEGIKKGGFYE